MSSILSKLINFAGNITGILPTANGGTGLATIGTANQVLGVNSGATGLEYKTLSAGTAGTDFAVANAANSVTYNLPDAGASARGVVTTGTQTFAGAKSFSSIVTQTSSAGFKVDSTVDATLQTDSTNSYLDSSGPLIFRTNGTTNALTFSTSQVPTFTGGNYRLTASSGGIGNSSSPYMTPSDDTDTGFYFNTNVIGCSSGGVGVWLTDSSGRMAIQGATNSGAWLTVYATSNNAIRLVSDGTSGTQGMQTFIDGAGTACGSITIDATANTTAYNITSDERLKTKFARFDAVGILEKIEALSYERKSNPGVIEYGVKAQQLHGIYPTAVTPGGDKPETEPWMIDYSKMVGILLRSVQQLNDRIKILESK